MKSYDEIYRNVLRRRDEQIAKSRRRIAVVGSVLPAVMVSLAAVAGVAALQGVPQVESGASANADVNAAGMPQQTEITEPPVQLVGQRLIFTENGENIDITDMISDDTPYIYEDTDTKTGLVRYAIVGGTPQNYGWAKFVMHEKNTEQPELSKWINYSCNTFAADRQDRKWYDTAIHQLGEKPENLGICVWSMTERAWELVSLDNTVSTVAAQDSLDGYTATLELIAVTHEPAAGEYYYTAERAVLTVNDPDGNTATVTLNSIDTINQNVRGKWDTDENGNLKSRVKLWAMDYNGEKRYMVSVGFYREATYEYIEKLDIVDDEPTYATMFFGFDTEVFEDGTLRPYGESVYGDGIVFGLSDSFRFDNGTTFVEDGHDFFVIFDPDSYDVTDSYDLANHPVHGKSNYGYSIGLTLYDLTHLPKYDGEDYYAAEDARLYVTDGEYGLAEIYLSQCVNSMVYDEFVKNLNASHEDDCVTLLKLNDNGEEHYVVMLRNYHGEYDYPFYRTAFFECDPKSWELTPYELEDYTYADDGFVSINEPVGVENRDGQDILVTLSPYILTYGKAKEADGYLIMEIEFDHENHIVSCTPTDREHR